MIETIPAAEPKEVPVACPDCGGVLFLIRESEVAERLSDDGAVSGEPGKLVGKNPCNVCAGN